MCHSCVSRNPGLFPQRQEPREYGLFVFSGFPLSQEGHSSPTLAFGQADLSR